MTYRSQNIDWGKGTDEEKYPPFVFRAIDVKHPVLPPNDDRTSALEWLDRFTNRHIDQLMADNWVMVRVIRNSLTRPD